MWFLWCPLNCYLCARQFWWNLISLIVGAHTRIKHFKFRLIRINQLNVHRQWCHAKTASIQLTQQSECKFFFEVRCGHHNQHNLHTVSSVHFFADRFASTYRRVHMCHLIEFNGKHFFVFTFNATITFLSSLACQMDKQTIDLWWIIKGLNANKIFQSANMRFFPTPPMPFHCAGDSILWVF